MSENRRRPLALVIVTPTNDTSHILSTGVVEANTDLRWINQSWNSNDIRRTPAS